MSTKEQDRMTNITRLPKWVQEYIRRIQRQRDVAIRTLNAFCDKQTPSSIYVEDNPCTGEGVGPVSKRNYIQSHTVTIKHAGVWLFVLCRDDSIELNYSNEDESCRNVALQPIASNAIRLVAKDHLD